MIRITSTRTTAVRRSLTSALVLAGGLLVISPSLRAQTPPPIDGVTGTIAPGASIQADGAIHAAIVKTAGGVEHLFHYAKALFVHGKKGGDAEHPPAP